MCVLSRPSLRPILAGAALLTTLLLAPAPSAQAAETEPPEYAGMIEAHNAVRRQVGVRPLSWSSIAARQAQGWADQLARENCALRYNPDPTRRELYGENVLKHWSSRPYEGFKRRPGDVVARWAEEGAWYDYAGNRCNAPAGRICGSYLQVVWDETEVVGCGRARCDTGEVWVCNYTPRGNKIATRPFGNPPPTPVPAPAAEPLECFALGAEPPAVAASPVPAPRAAPPAPAPARVAPPAPVARPASPPAPAPMPVARPAPPPRPAPAPAPATEPERAPQAPVWAGDDIGTAEPIPVDPDSPPPR